MSLPQRPGERGSGRLRFIRAGGPPGALARLAAALPLALLLAGCLDQFRPEGEESLTIRNLDQQPVEVIFRIQTAEGGGAFTVFAQDIVLEVGEAREYVLALSAGGYRAFLTTSTRIDEVFPLEVPPRGDSHYELRIVRGAATLSRS